VLHEPKTGSFHALEHAGGRLGRVLVADEGFLGPEHVEGAVDAAVVLEDVPFVRELDAA